MRQEATDHKINSIEVVELIPPRPGLVNLQGREISQQHSEVVSTLGNTHHTIPEATEQDFGPTLPARIDTEMRIGVESASLVGFLCGEARASASTHSLHHDVGSSSNIQHRAQPLERQITSTYSHGI